MGVMHPGLVMKNIIPVVMAGVLGIYGLIVAVIIQGSSKSAQSHSCMHFTAFELYDFAFFSQSPFLLRMV